VLIKSKGNAICFNKFYQVMIPNQEEKFEAVYKSLTEKATEQILFNTFLKMYPDAWKQLKITFSTYKRSKQFGKTIPLPRPEESLRKSIRIWLKRTNDGS
jgi:transposase-like protein